MNINIWSVGVRNLGTRGYEELLIGTLTDSPIDALEAVTKKKSREGFVFESIRPAIRQEIHLISDIDIIDSPGHKEGSGFKGDLNLNVPEGAALRFVDDGSITTTVIMSKEEYERHQQADKQESKPSVADGDNKPKPSRPSVAESINKVIKDNSEALRKMAENAKYQPVRARGFGIESTLYPDKGVVGLSPVIDKDGREVAPEEWWLGYTGDGTMKVNMLSKTSAHKLAMDVVEAHRETIRACYGRADEDVVLGANQDFMRRVMPILDRLKTK